MYHKSYTSTYKKYRIHSYMYNAHPIHVVVYSRWIVCWWLSLTYFGLVSKATHEIQRHQNSQMLLIRTVTHNQCSVGRNLHNLNRWKSSCGDRLNLKMWINNIVPNPHNLNINSSFTRTYIFIYWNTNYIEQTNHNQKWYVELWTLDPAWLIGINTNTPLMELHFLTLNVQILAYIQCINKIL